jgi:hypothetical protein
MQVTSACAWCQRVRTTAGEWVSVELADPDSPGMTHGICPACLEREIRAIGVADPGQLALREG